MNPYRKPKEDESYHYPFGQPTNIVAVTIEKTAPYSAKFYHTLINLDLPPAWHGALLTNWKILSAENPPEPAISINGLEVTFSWTREDYSLVVSFVPEGCDWFWKDRVTGEVEGTDDEPEKEINPRILEILRTISNKKE